MSSLNICHLYGNLLNTYGDIGNLLVMKFLAKREGYDVNVDLISIGDSFDPQKYNFVFMGGGQDYEQKVIAQDFIYKKEDLNQYINQNGVMLAICGGYQLLGDYYETAQGERIEGIGVLPHYTKRQENNRFIGNIEIKNNLFDKPLVGFENHNGRTFLGKGEEPLGTVVYGYGNNGEDQQEGAIFKNVFCSYFHGPLLVRNRHFAEYLLQIAIRKKTFR